MRRSLVVDSPALAHPLAEPLARAIATVVPRTAIRSWSARRHRRFRRTSCRARPHCLGGAMASDVVRHELVDGQLAVR